MGLTSKCSREINAVSLLYHPKQFYQFRLCLLAITNECENFRFFRLMAIFEAGIITKMTQNEYEKLRKQKLAFSSKPDNVRIQRSQKENKRSSKTNKANDKLQPVTFKMVQGAFYILAIGSIISGKYFNLCRNYLRFTISGFMLLGEKLFDNKKKQKTLRSSAKYPNKLGSSIRKKFEKIKEYTKKIYRRIMHEAFVATLEYLE